MRKTQTARGSDLYYYNAGGTAVDQEEEDGTQLAFDKALFSRDKGVSCTMENFVKDRNRQR